MLVIPSIDVRGGRVVRLLRGEFQHETSYPHDPVAVVRSFAEAGATRVHVVDLDAARGDTDQVSRSAVGAVLRELSGAGVAVQVGGGVRGEAAARRWFELGAGYVVVGSLAITDPTAARLVCEAFPGMVLLGLDVRGGEARSQGWTESGGTATDNLSRWSGWPSAGVVYTTIERDGTLEGPDLTALSEVSHLWDGPLFSSGGIRDLDDVAACARAGAAGVIIGRALHDGLFDLREAVRRFPPAAAA